MSSSQGPASYNRNQKDSCHAPKRQRVEAESNRRISSQSVVPARGPAGVASTIEHPLSGANGQPAPQSQLTQVYYQPPPQTSYQPPQLYYQPPHQSFSQRQTTTSAPLAVAPPIPSLQEIEQVVTQLHPSVIHSLYQTISASLGSSPQPYYQPIAPSSQSVTPLYTTRKIPSSDWLPSEDALQVEYTPAPGQLMLPPHMQSLSPGMSAEAFSSPMMSQPAHPATNWQFQQQQQERHSNLPTPTPSVKGLSPGSSQRSNRSSTPQLPIRPPRTQYPFPQDKPDPPLPVRHRKISPIKVKEESIDVEFLALPTRSHPPRRSMPTFPTRPPLSQSDHPPLPTRPSTSVPNHSHPALPTRPFHTQPTKLPPTLPHQSQSVSACPSPEQSTRPSPPLPIRPRPPSSASSPAKHQPAKDRQEPFSPKKLKAEPTSIRVKRKPSSPTKVQPSSDSDPYPKVRIKRETDAEDEDEQPRRKLITEGCQRYELPENCKKSLGNADFQKNRIQLAKAKRSFLQSKLLSVKKVLFRDDGMVIEWTSAQPVWNDTLLPDCMDLATAIRESGTSHLSGSSRQHTIRAMDLTASPRSRTTGTTSGSRRMKSPLSLGEDSGPPGPSAQQQRVLPDEPPLPIVRPSRRDLPPPKPQKKHFKPVEPRRLKRAKAVASAEDDVRQPQALVTPISGAERWKGKSKEVQVSAGMDLEAFPSLPVRPVRRLIRIGGNEEKPGKRARPELPPAAVPVAKRQRVEEEDGGVKEGHLEGLSLNQQGKGREDGEESVPPIATLDEDDDDDSEDWPEEGGEAVDMLLSSSPVATRRAVPVARHISAAEDPDWEEEMELERTLLEGEQARAEDIYEDEPPSVRLLAQDFIVRYMQTFDRDRSQLEMAYSTNAIFSASIHRLPQEGSSSMGELFCPRECNCLNGVDGRSRLTTPFMCSKHQYFQGRGKIIDRLNSLGPHKFDYKRDWRPPVYDLVVRPYRGQTEAIQLTVHGNTVNTNSVTGMDHVLSVNHTLVLCRPEDLSVEEREEDLEVGEGLGVLGVPQKTWPLLAISHQMIVRDRPLMFEQEMRECGEWIEGILKQG
ncbi:hypothetical protein FA15DRAFT_703990 [Coprinopsis marcescibilis]|uniref:Nuclear transport factor 2 domain-containing protein n=1 Tax=Coprinopsis marcescibilis TaxID=230819 RepID=A0A5C3KX83_COPMA|nr:hypothetical protein FA15DRAFT_703990 [Coprinopsis marcescibilis]